jgi:hypothetical protein
MGSMLSDVGPFSELPLIDGQGGFLPEGNSIWDYYSSVATSH